MLGFGSADGLIKTTTVITVMERFPLERRIVIAFALVLRHFLNH